MSLSRLILLPSLVFACLFVTLTYGGVDHYLAGKIFAAQGHHWAWRDIPLLTQGFHRIGKNLSTVAWLGCIIALVVSRKQGLVPTRRALWVLVISVALSTLLVSVAKSLTHMDCPWDLIDFGGTKQFVPLFQRDLVNASAGKCFPAGQASAGYAWIALYFAALIARPQWRKPALALGLGFGAALGIAQQLRGAHFLSHDLTTVWICWCVAALVYYFMSRNARPEPLRVAVPLASNG